jgi:hypothetical protein
MKVSPHNAGLFERINKQTVKKQKNNQRQIDSVKKKQKIYNRVDDNDD